MLTLTADGSANHVGRLRSPHKRCGVEIPVIDVVVDMLCQRVDRIEGGATYSLSDQDAEPSIDHVQPGAPLGVK